MNVKQISQAINQDERNIQRWIKSLNDKMTLSKSEQKKLLKSLVLAYSPRRLLSFFI